MQDVEGASEASSTGSLSQGHVASESAQEGTSAQDTAPGTAEGLPREPQADAAVDPSPVQSPAASSAASPQSSFPGFQVAQQADDTASSPEAVGPAQQQVSSPKIQVSHQADNAASSPEVARPAEQQKPSMTGAPVQQQEGPAVPSSPTRQGATGWGALFSPERSPAAGTSAGFAASPIGLPVNLETPIVMARGTPPPPPTGMQTPWDALFSSPGGPANALPAPAFAHSPGPATAEPLLVSGQPLPAPSSATPHVPSEQDTGVHSGDAVRGGGFVALLEASLTELAGPSQTPDAVTAAVSRDAETALPSAGDDTSSLPQPSLLAVACSADELHGQDVEQQDRGSEVILLQPCSAADASPAEDSPKMSPVQQNVVVEVNVQQSTPGPSISLDLILAPARAQTQSADSPLDSEATLTMQQGHGLQREVQLIDTPSWGWGVAQSPQASFQTGLGACEAGSESREGAAGLVSRSDTAIPASPAESVGSATGPQERLEGSAVLVSHFLLI